MYYSFRINSSIELLITCKLTFQEKEYEEFLHFQKRQLREFEVMQVQQAHDIERIQLSSFAKSKAQCRVELQTNSQSLFQKLVDSNGFS